MASSVRNPRPAAGEPGAFRSLAAGFRARLTSDQLVVEAPFPPPGWTPPAEGDLVRLPVPGTPVRFGERYFEVVEEEPLGHGELVRYVLRPWDERDVMRGLSELSIESCQGWAAERKAARKRDRTAGSLILLMPLVGLLPAADQNRIERELGLHASRMTLVSAVTFGALTLPAAFVGLIASFVPGFLMSYPELGWTETWMPPLAYFALESWVRAHTATSNGDALGSLPVVLVVGTWRLIAGARRRS